MKTVKRSGICGTPGVPGTCRLQIWLERAEDNDVAAWYAFYAGTTMDIPTMDDPDSP